MDGRLKTRTPGTVPGTLGRQFGVIPLGAKPQIQRHISSGEKQKPLQRIPPHSPLVTPPGTGSSSSANRVRRKSSKAEIAKRKSSSGFHTDDEQEDVVGQDIKFINVPDFRCSSRLSGDVGEKKEFSRISEHDILLRCQEREPTKVYDIDLHASDIALIQNLDKFKKLKILDLSCNYIEKIQNLDLNNDLRELKLYDNKLKCIENLTTLKELCSLQLQHNKIRTVGKALNHLKKLKTLRLDSNVMMKIESAEICGCSNLTVLDISNNMIDNLNALNSLPNLEELYATGNRLRSVTDLTRCKRLQEIDLSRNNLSDVSGLRNLPLLQTLDLTKNQLTTLKSLGKLKALLELMVQYNQLTELKALRDMTPRLEVLNASDNNISDWKEVCSLNHLEALAELSVAGNPFCEDGGVMPQYFTEIHSVLPNLDILDGASVKKPTLKSNCAPLMRPMSASSIVSVRQMESQMKSQSDDLHSFEENFKKKFEEIRTLCQSLPAEAPHSRPPSLSLNLPTGENTSEALPSSRCSSRSRIRRAQEYAKQYLGET